MTEPNSENTAERSEAADSPPLSGESSPSLQEMLQATESRDQRDDLRSTSPQAFDAARMQQELAFARQQVAHANQRAEAAEQRSREADQRTAQVEQHALAVQQSFSQLAAAFAGSDQRVSEAARDSDPEQGTIEAQQAANVAIAEVDARAKEAEARVGEAEARAATAEARADESEEKAGVLQKKLAESKADSRRLEDAVCELIEQNRSDTKEAEQTQIKANETIERLQTQIGSLKHQVEVLYQSLRQESESGQETRKQLLAKTRMLEATNISLTEAKYQLEALHLELQEVKDRYEDSVSELMKRTSPKSVALPKSDASPAANDTQVEFESTTEMESDSDHVGGSLDRGQAYSTAVEASVLVETPATRPGKSATTSQAPVISDLPGDSWADVANQPTPPQAKSELRHRRTQSIGGNTVGPDKSPRSGGKSARSEEAKRSQARRDTFDDRYLLQHTLGVGGYAKVVQGKDRKLGFEVAVKIPVVRVVEGQDAKKVRELRKKMVDREAELLSSLQHPNILRLLDTHSFEPDEPPKLLLEKLDGRLLSDILAEGRLSIDRTRILFGQLCNAMEAAHDKSIIHRDLKPQNLMVVETNSMERLVVLDFGIAKLEGQQFNESYQQPMGTPGYWSPEQEHGLVDVSTRSDIFSMGVILYEMLTSKRPKLQSWRGSASESRIVCPSVLHPEVSAKTGQIVLKALSAEPANRFTRPLEFLGAFEESLSKRSFVQRMLAPFLD